ncbi:hypothetical protein [Caballeronia sp. Lep1P3]|uniref:hypothetical protein n=1 Tax=Burkholderiaceae TaxID=119060 RepID=UPI001FD0ABE6|nr:hypothetical protein [Caballeronia sp. Lep1P3]
MSTPNTNPTEHSLVLRGYQSSIDTCRQQFRIVNNENTKWGATPGAFRGNQSGPEGYPRTGYEIYNAWAEAELKKLIVLKRDGKLSGMVTSPQSFDEWHKNMLASLHEAWAAQAHREFPLKRRQSHKLVNLFIKWLRIKPIPQEFRNAIEQWGHTTLSKPTMNRIGGLLQDDTLAFPPEEQFDDWYRMTQQRLREFTQENGGSPMLVDIYCRWESLGDPDED